MTANELADKLEGYGVVYVKFEYRKQAATMLRQQQTEIERLTMLCDCMTTESNRKGNELADELDRVYELSNIGELEIAATCIRQQQAEIEALKKELALQRLSDIGQAIDDWAWKIIRFCGLSTGNSDINVIAIHKDIVDILKLRELTNEEIESAYWSLVGKQHEGKIASYLYNFARDILMKAREMYQITCKNCHKEFNGIMGECGGSNTCTIYRCAHCQHEETIKRKPIDWSKALIVKAQEK